MTTTDALPVFEAHEEWKRARALLESMYAWANDTQEQIMRHVRRGAGHTRRRGRRAHDARPQAARLVPRPRRLLPQPPGVHRSDASYAALAADVRAYKAEVAAAEAAHRKRRRAELKAERAAEPPAPARAQPPRASKRARGSA
jgi:hypothetical protein